MFGPILHGSYGKEEKDYEACDALRTLLEAEAIKHCGDEEFLGRIDTELQKQLAAMQRVDSLIAGLRSGWDDDEDMYQSSPRGSTAHTWIMGDAIDARTLISRVVMTPELVDLAYALKEKLSLVQQDPQSDDAFYINKGFQAHLDVIKIILTGCARGTVSAIQASILKAQANRQPSNALYVAAASRYGKANPEDAADFLLDSHHFPSSRLPSKAEHCEPYLFQRDANSADWEPCGTAEELHDGTDFVVAASILDGSL